MDTDRWEGFREGFGDGAEFRQIPMQKAERDRFYRDNLDWLRTFSAVFAVSDFYALELMRLLQAQGVAVPGEIAVAGFDDTTACRQSLPPLTSVRQDVALRAGIALEKLRDLREKKESEMEIVLPVTLVVRESTGFV